MIFTAMGMWVLLAPITPADPADWMKRLTAPDPTLKSEARQALPGLEDDVKERLAEQLSEALEDPALRLDAAAALEHLVPQAERALPRLMKLIREEAPEEVHRRVMRVLGAIGSPAKDALPDLVIFLHQPNPTLSAGAVDALARLVEIPRTASPPSRRLPMFNTEPLIGSRANSPDPLTLKTEDFLPPLPPPSNRHPWSPALPALLTLLHEGRREARLPTIDAVGVIGPDALPAAPYLIEALDDGNARIRRQAALALKRLGPGTIPRLTEALKDHRPALVRMAAEYLGEYRKASRGAVPQLIRAVAHADSDVREQAVWALGEIGEDSPPVREALKNALQDASPEVRRQAEWSLKKLTRGPN